MNPLLPTEFDRGCLAQAAWAAAISGDLYLIAEFQRQMNNLRQDWRELDSSLARKMAHIVYFAATKHTIEEKS